jgi:hypothetical protein
MAIREEMIMNRRKLLFGILGSLAAAPLALAGATSPQAAAPPRQVPTPNGVASPIAPAAPHTRLETVKDSKLEAVKTDWTQDMVHRRVRRGARRTARRVRRGERRTARVVRRTARRTRRVM